MDEMVFLLQDEFDFMFITSFQICNHCNVMNVFTRGVP